MNTRSRTRKQTYATTLIIVNQLNSYFATFSIELQRSNIISIVLKLHKNNLSTKSRYWRQMLNHCFFQEFKSTAIKKMIELKKRDIFLLIEKRSNQIKISLIWMFKYKFYTNKYVKKFKARLCFRNDLQMIHQNIYAITLIASTFWALMIIATAFNLNIWQYDAINAFINNSIDEKIYNEYFDNFFKLDYFWKLLKVLYDLKQTSILWYRNLINVFEDLRLMSMLEINCLYANDCVKMMILKQSKRKKTIFRRRKFDILIRSI
jgi:hypothetical protein